MKGIVLSSFLTAVLVSGGFVIVQMSLKGEGNSRAAVALEEQALENRFAGIEDKLEGFGTLDDIVRLVESRLDSRRPAVSRAVVRMPDDSDATIDAQDTELVASSQAERQAKSLRSSGKSSELREFIATVIEDERSARDQRRSEKKRERSRAFKEMNEGPYGKHNFKVNSLAKKLDFSEKQKEHYYNTLVQYGDEFKAARKGVKWSDSEAVKIYQTSRKELNEEFHTAVALGLDREQAEQYSDLPDWQKNPEGHGGSTILRAMGEPGGAVFSFDAAGIQGGPPELIIGQSTVTIGETEK